MKYSVAKIEAMEASGGRPPGYADACLAAAYKADGRWLWLDADAYRKLANRYRPQPIPADFDPAQEARRMRQGGCCGQASEPT